MTDLPPLGVGIDAVTISEIARLDREVPSFAAYTFTERELARAQTANDRASFLAGRFAVKEAAFKALAHLTPAGTFNLRIIETLPDEHGAPHIQMTDELSAVCAEAGVSRLLVSITNEGDLALAIVVAY